VVLVHSPALPDVHGNAHDQGNRGERHQDADPLREVEAVERHAGPLLLEHLRTIDQHVSDDRADDPYNCKEQSIHGVCTFLGRENSGTRSVFSVLQPISYLLS
jgi:hypothetical protein